MKIIQILVYGLIGSYINDKGDKVKGLELEDVIAQVNAHPGFDEVHVKINSSGGNAQAGFDIYHYLKSLGKPITTMVEGKCESIATVIALAGEKRTITAESIFMIHNPWGQPVGDADEIAAAAKELKVVEDQIIAFYHEHTGIEKTALDALMKKETEMNPTIAVDMKFMTEMVGKVEAMAYAPDRKLNIVAVTTSPANDFIAKMKKFMAGDMSIFAQKDVTSTLADGTQIMIKTEDGTVAVGNEVTKGGQPLEDGDHKMLDGSSMATKEGKISGLTPKVDAAETDENKDDNPAVAKLQAENAALKLQMNAITQNQNIANEGQLAMIKTMQVIGANMKSDYKPDADIQSFNQAGGGGKKSDNCVKDIKDREKDYKDYKKDDK